VNGRLKILVAMLAIFGLAFIAGGGYTFYKTNQGANSLQAFSAAQNVKLTYNAAGQLADAKGSTEESTAIMSELTNDWGYAVNSADFNPNDPLVNTASEYMYQMATIAYHTLHGTTTVVLPADVTVGDTVYTAGTYQFSTDGRYWTGFNRANPIEAIARDQIWTGTAHALIAELGVGSVTASTIQVGFGIAAMLAGFGATMIFFSFGLLWATRTAPEKVKVPVLRPATTLA
jgi:hypothetical protein